MTTKGRLEGGLGLEFGSIDAQGNLIIKNEDITRLIDRHKEAALREAAESTLLDRLLSRRR